MELVPISTLPNGATFRCPWRNEGAQYGQLKYCGAASAIVRVPKALGDGWDNDVTWSLGTLVEPCTDKEYLEQTYGSRENNPNASTVVSPVKRVWAICDEMDGNRKAILAKAEEEGINRNTAKTQYYKWKKNK